MWALPAPPFSLFVLALSFFHCSEFVLALTFDRSNLGWHCEFLNRSGRCRNLACCSCAAAAVAAATAAAAHHRPSRLPPIHAAWLFSWPYCTAMLAACVEHAAELHWAPGLKLPAVSWAGLVAVAAGELLRKAAMVSLECRLCKSLPAGSVWEHAE